MPASLEYTGERFTPECVREIRYEHFHRYALAARWCAGSRVLDAACGEGYGAALLAATGATVTGVDISAAAIAHAKARYGQQDRLEFQVTDCTALPFAEHEFDRVVSFETLEHLAAQDEMLAEFKRVLKPDGCLILSSPDKAVYSEQHNACNEFHRKELYADELKALLGRHFPAWRLLGQKLMFHSAIWSMDELEKVSFDQLCATDSATGSSVNLPVTQGITQAPMYFIALCAANEVHLPKSDGQLWLFDDREETVYQHYYGEIKRNMAAGGIIAGMAKEIEALKQQLDTPPTHPASSRPVSWWRRLFG